VMLGEETTEDVAGGIHAGSLQRAGAARNNEADPALAARSARVNASNAAQSSPPGAWVARGTRMLSTRSWISSGGASVTLETA